MPGIFFQPISRRNFMTRSLGGIGVAATWSPLAQAVDPTLVDDHFHLALLSDTHLPADASNEYRGFKPTENLRKVVPAVIASAPAGVIINGDAARLEGFQEDYTALKRELAPLAKSAPIYIGLGNHDDRKNFDSVFATPDAQKNVSGKHVVVIENRVVNVIVLDSLLYVNRVAGLLGKDQRNWLKQYLQENRDKPTVLFVHHTLGDGDGDLLDADRLFRLIKPFANVKAIFYGHSHRYAFENRDSVHLINLPAVGYNFNDDQPVGWVDAKFSETGVALKLHAIGGEDGGDGKTTEIKWF